MRRLRFSLFCLMAFLAVTALDMAVIRSLLRHRPGSNKYLYLVPLDGDTHWIPFATLALGVLPMASLLVLAAIYHVPEIRRRGTVSGFWLGFETFGWFSVFLFMASSSLSPEAIQRYMATIINPLVSPVLWVLGSGASRWLVDGVIFAMCGFLLVLPELVLATVGGRLVNRVRVGVVTRRVAEETSTSPRDSGDPVSV